MENSKWPRAQEKFWVFNLKTNSTNASSQITFNCLFLFKNAYRHCIFTMTYKFYQKIITWMDEVKNVDGPVN